MCRKKEVIIETNSLRRSFTHIVPNMLGRDNTK